MKQHLYNMNNTSNFHYRFVEWIYEYGPDPDQTHIDYKCYGMNTPLARKMQFRWYRQPAISCREFTILSLQ